MSGSNRREHDPTRLAPLSLDALLDLHGSAFIRSAYRRLLLREADQSGLSSYLAELRAGRPRVLILAGMARSREARRLAVNLPGLRRRALFQRLAGVPGLGMLIRRLTPAEGMSREDVERRVREEAACVEPESP